MAALADFVRVRPLHRAPLVCTIETLRWLRRRRIAFDRAVKNATDQRLVDETENCHRIRAALRDESGAPLERKAASMGELEARIDPVLPERTGSVFDAWNIAVALDEYICRYVVNDLYGYYQDQWSDDPGAWGPNQPVSFRVREGSPVPVCDFRARHQDGDMGSLDDAYEQAGHLWLTARSLPIDQSSERLRNVLLATSAVKRVETWLDFSFSTIQIDPTLPLATGHHRAGLAGLPLGDDSTDLRSCNIAMLDTVAAHDGRLGALVFPEGGWHHSPDVLDQAARQWQGMATGVRPQVFVPGSEMRPSTKPGLVTNRARVHIWGQDGMVHTAEHDKFEPERHYGPHDVYPRRHRSGTSRLSDLTCGGPHKVTVHVLARGYKVCLLVCRDLLVPDVVRVIEDLAVNLVLVPAHTMKMAPFASIAQNLATNFGCRTVVANTRRTRDPGFAIVGDPTRADGLRLYIHGEGDSPRSCGVAVASTSSTLGTDGSMEWWPTPVDQP